MRRTTALAAALFLILVSSGFSAESKQLVSADNPKTKTIAKKPPAAKAEAKPVKKGFELPDPDPALVKLDVKPQKTQGIVTGRSAYGVAVEYAADKKTGGQEIWFNYSKGIKLVGLKELKEIGEGDVVNVTYKTGPDNRKLIQELALVRKKPAEPAAAPEVQELEEEGS